MRRFLNHVEGLVFPPHHPRVTHSRFGDAAITLFLIVQAADGAFTYIGVKLLGLGAEANPLLLTLMVTLGAVPALLSAKALAAGLGIALHLLGVHRIVATLTAIYAAGAVVPWMEVLLRTR